MYLVAVMDWLSRRVLSWRVSNTLDREFCVEALEEALARYGRRRSSTPTKAHSSPPRRSPTYSRRTGWRSAWTARGGGSTMSSLSDCGEA